MFTSILIPIDLAHKEQMPRLMEAARCLLGPGGSLRLLYVDRILEHRSGFPQLGDENYQSHEAQAWTQLRELAKGVAQDTSSLTCNIREGAVHDQILEEAEAIGADAILMMAKKPGVSSYFIGSTAERVTRHADCSVFVLRNK